MATQKKLRKEIIPLCKIYMVEKGTFDESLKGGGGKEELG